MGIKNRQISDRKSYDLSFSRIAWSHVRELKSTTDPCKQDTDLWKPQSSNEGLDWRPC